MMGAMLHIHFDSRGRGKGEYVTNEINNITGRLDKLDCVKVKLISIEKKK